MFIFLSLSLSLSLPGGGGPQLRRCRPICPPKPPDLVQRPKVPGGLFSRLNLTPASSTSSVSSCVSSTSDSSTVSFRHLLQRRTPIIPGTVRLPHGVLAQSAASKPTPNYTPRASTYLARRREHPGRRKDSTQSLYIDNPECDLLHFSSCPPSTSSSSSSMVTPSPQHQHRDAQATTGQRRFSDPDMPFIDDGV
ncbi:hypothetical protein VZT92_022060 [Zoarces viviparus]|uniref:Uncharacterized protein n=1 Tax=Zoarces viviparus TaxID=48416 RepID=A0AAW1EB67_ZOAVI